MKKLAFLVALILMFSLGYTQSSVQLKSDSLLRLIQQYKNEDTGRISKLLELSKLYNEANISDSIFLYAQ